MVSKEDIMKEAEKTEPPSCLRPPIFMIGRDSRGSWVVREQSGARGGIFVDRAAAVKFAHDENGTRPHAVVMVSGSLELDAMPAPAIASRARLAGHIARQRRTA